MKRTEVADIKPNMTKHNKENSSLKSSEREQQRKQNREKKYNNLLNRLQAKEELTKKEQIQVQLWGESFSIKDLTLPKILKSLAEFRSTNTSSVNKKKAKAKEVKAPKQDKVEKADQQIQTQVEENKPSPQAEETDEQSQTEETQASNAQIEEAEQVYKEPTWEQRENFIFELLDVQAFAKKTLKGLFQYAQAEAVTTYYQLAVQEVADLSIPLEEGQALLGKLRKIFRKSLRRYAKTCNQNKQHRSSINALYSFYQNTVLPEWTQQLDYWKYSYPDQHEDLEELRELYERQLQDMVRHFQGRKAKKSMQKKLYDLLEDSMDAIEDQLHRTLHRKKLKEVYQTKSDIALFFPEARGMKRELHFYCGPTNSGKTYSALNELAKSNSGVYLAPLRLMALEGQQELQDRGAIASYITGEEKNQVPGATFIASTIEMLDYWSPVDTALIDEIQMIDSPHRGWAWTNALLGVPAKKVYMTGSEDALPLIQTIADYLNEPLFVKKFERFNPLVPMKQPAHRSFRRLKPGTAIICFSRRDVLGLKSELEKQTNFKVSVIYGGLSPDVRRQEAGKFRSKESDILVATDAISMGLNLPIHTLLFWTTEKVYGGKVHPLQPTEIKQIGGRAGRYGIQNKGFVGAFHSRDLRRIQESMDAELGELEGPCFVMPLIEHIELISDVLQTDHLGDILRYFKRELWFSRDIFFPMVTDEMQMLADSLESIMEEASLKIKYIFTCAPVDRKARHVLDSFMDFTIQFANQHEVLLPVESLKRFKRGIARDDMELRKAEDEVKVLTIYRWLSYRFPDEFVDIEDAEKYKRILNDYISRSLSSGRFQKKCPRCSKPLAFDFRFNICEKCFQRGRYR